MSRIPTGRPRARGLPCLLCYPVAARGRLACRGNGANTIFSHQLRPASTGRGSFMTTRFANHGGFFLAPAQKRQGRTKSNTSTSTSGHGDIAPGDGSGLGRSDGGIQKGAVGHPKLCVDRTRDGSPSHDHVHDVDGVASGVVDVTAFEARLQMDLSRAAVHTKQKRACIGVPSLSQLRRAYLPADEHPADNSSPASPTTPPDLQFPLAPITIDRLSPDGHDRDMKSPECLA